MPLRPWYHVAVPREDLREGRPLDAAEFAVHLDRVKTGDAPDEYTRPEPFFARTYLTQNLTDMAAQVVRRLSGETTATSAVFNLVTQFGGGKTHALTLLYHLAEHGPDSVGWTGVGKILERAHVPTVPHARTAIFVGQRFDPRGGNDGTPRRETPWGEVAWQLGGPPGYEVFERFDRERISPGGDSIDRLFTLVDQPILILLDEVVNYVSRHRRDGLGAQLYNFVQNLSEEVIGHQNVVLAASIPASELEMSAEDQADYERFKKLLDRLGKAVLLSAEAETSEIIRRRLFEWDPQAVDSHGRVLLDRDALATCAEYGAWAHEHRQQLPGWFPFDRAREAFAATYPFHPLAISVFERKWQSLPRFQRTRGVLRMLALWVSRAYSEDTRNAARDPLIGLGSAPLEDPLFRAEVFEQLGESRLEGAVTTDICGRPDAHAVRLDSEAVDTLRKARLHRKVATAIFFESNGGQARAEATLPEIRLAAAEPGLDIGNIETVLEGLRTSCYYLSADGNRYRFSLTPNLNKIFADRSAAINPADIDDRVRAEVQKVFAAGSGVERKYFPEKSGDLPDRPLLTFVVMPPDEPVQDERTLRRIEALTRESGTSSRIFKSALIWCVADAASNLRDEARKVLAWEAIRDEDLARLDEGQKNQLNRDLPRAQSNVREAVWRTYKHLVLLGKENELRSIDIGQMTSSSADNLTGLLLRQLRQSDDVVETISPNFLVRNWPPAFREWSTKAVRDAFFASPLFPRLLSADAVRDTIARGVSNGILAYVGKAGSDKYRPFFFGEPITALDVEISEDMYIIPGDLAREYQDQTAKPAYLAALTILPDPVQLKPGASQTFRVRGADQHGREFAEPQVSWSATGGEIGPDGTFRAGNEPGNFRVTAAAGDIRAVAGVIVAREGQRVEPKPPPEPKPLTDRTTSLSWTGEILAQKWMNFYTKVLTKFASGKGLKLTLNVEVHDASGISEQKVEEMRIALRELGLKDDITVS